CSSGTDPGDCQRADCLPAIYGVGIIESKHTSVDTLPPIYSLFAIIEHEDGVYTGNNTVDHLIEFNDRLASYAVGESFSLTLNDQRDTLSVAPSGAYNIWKIVVDGTPVVCDSIQTPVDPLRITSPGNREYFDPSEDVVLTIDGDFGSVTSAELRPVLGTDFDVIDLENIPVTSNRVVIPASVFRDYRGERLRLNIFLYQTFVKKARNAFGDPVQVSYIRNYKTLLLSQP
ncbi:MAG: hypothetical protein AB7H80_17400, partial [Candidatus Kapaibacterium sp.]